MSEGNVIPFVFSPNENMSTIALFTGMLKVIEDAFDSLDPLVKTIKAKSTISRQKMNVLYSMNEMVKVLNLKFQQSHHSLTLTSTLIKCDATTQTETHLLTSISKTFKFPLERLSIDEETSLNENDKFVTTDGFTNKNNNKTNHFTIGNRKTIKMTNNINTLIQKINPSELIIGGGGGISNSTQQKQWTPTTSSSSESSLNSPDRSNNGGISSLFISNHQNLNLNQHSHNQQQQPQPQPQPQHNQHHQHQPHLISPSSSSSSSTSISNYTQFTNHNNNCNNSTTNLIISSTLYNNGANNVQHQQHQQQHQQHQHQHQQTNQDIPVPPPPPILKCTNSSLFDKTLARNKSGPPPPPRRSDKTRLSGRY